MSLNRKMGDGNVLLVFGDLDGRRKAEICIV